MFGVCNAGLGVELRLLRHAGLNPRSVGFPLDGTVVAFLEQSSVEDCFYGGQNTPCFAG